MAKILLLSGPNLNLLGEREPEHYGTTTLAELVALASETAAKLGHDVEHLQSNHEGALIDAIHGARGRCAAIVINAGAFTHYAYAITDALAMFEGVKIEVHLSNPYAREVWRHHSVIAPVVDGTITGLHARRVTASRSRPSGRASPRNPGARMIVTSELVPLDIAPRLGRLRAARRRAARRAPDHEAGQRPVPLGFTGSAAMLLVTPDDALFVTDGRYTEQSKEQLGAAGVDGEIRIEIGLTAAAQHAALARWSPGTRLGLEEHSVTWADQRGFVATFEGRRARSRRRAGRRPPAA